MTRDQLAARFNWSAAPGGQSRQHRYLDDLADYVMCCQGLTNSQAAKRLGVKRRTVERYRQRLRAIGALS